MRSSPIVPCLWFDDQAEEAAGPYTETFLPSFFVHVEGAAEADRAFSILADGGNVLMPPDAYHGHHGFTFNEAVSPQVMCEDQSEVDRYWTALSEGGERERCGWLKDRFGVSWQVVPISITEWMTSEDTAARDRAFDAMLGMRKLDIATLRAAFHGA